MLPFVFTFYRFGRSILSALKDPDFEALFTLLVILLVSGTLFYHSVEGWGYLNSLYFSVITLTTVGYGDFAPHTDLGKIFTMIYLLIGIGVLLGFVNVVTHHALQDSKNGTLLSERLGLRKRASDDEKENASEKDSN